MRHALTVEKGGGACVWTRQEEDEESTLQLCYVFILGTGLRCRGWVCCALELYIQWAVRQLLGCGTVWEEKEAAAHRHA